MNGRAKSALLLIAAITAVVLAGIVGRQIGQAGAMSPPGPEPKYTTDFHTENCAWSSTGANTFFILQPGYLLTLSGEEDPGVVTNFTVDVLNDTRVLDGVETRLVEEKVIVGGELKEIARNYFAICTQTNSVFYFGEDVDNYMGGQVADHHGSWLAGVNGARGGLYMAGTVTLGSRYFQEVAPGVALDRAEVVSMGEVVDAPAGRFEGVLETRDTSALENTLVEYKYYAAGIGLIQDGELQLESLP